MPLRFDPTRTAGHARLHDFAPNAGRVYARTRNFDHGPTRRDNVSLLSPYVRHRLVTEEEIVRAVLAQHSRAEAEKFIQEVCWRTYWKGWLEQHPDVWTTYVTLLGQDRARVADDDQLSECLARAEAGRTGIECFDSWATELVETGYLHNHARMWFASIWIFTLRQPWTLGADFFHRHLLDGDPASNTLSWRWVAGLHTRGKTYLARADNIRTYTSGRFADAQDLAAYAVPLDDDDPAPRRPLPPADPVPASQRVALLLTDDDLTPDDWGLAPDQVAGVALLVDEDIAADLSPTVRAFKSGARTDALRRAAETFRCPAHIVRPSEVRTWGGALFERGTGRIVSPRPPVGHGQPVWQATVDILKDQGAVVHAIRRPWDDLFWPHARAGFFQLKDKIPAVLGKLGLSDLPSRREHAPLDRDKGHT